MGSACIWMQAELKPLDLLVDGTCEACIYYSAADQLQRSVWRTKFNDLDIEGFQNIYNTIKYHIEQQISTVQWEG